MMDNLPPHSTEAEQGVLSCILQDPVASLDLCSFELPADGTAFYELRHQALYRSLVAMHNKSQLITLAMVDSHLRDQGTTDDAGGACYVSELVDKSPSPANLPSYLDVLIDKWSRRRLITTCHNIAENARHNPEEITGVIDRAQSEILAIGTEGNRRDDTVANVESTRFHPNNPPPEEPWAFKLAGVEVAHCGNIVTIAAAVKSGKSSIISAMTASIMSSIGQDYLGFEGNNPDGKAVLHYDTEQSRGDHYHMMMRALRRADLQAPPSWFCSYSLTLLDPAERRAAISAMARKAAANGGLHSLFIDGVADLVFDVNDLKEACSLVTELHQLATETSCVIVTALHHNPGGEKTRGHLGSQIERKSESVLVLRKEGETISISCKPARRQEISGDKAPCFSWDTKAAMHLLTQSKAATADDRKRIELGTLADEVFGDQSHLKWVALKNAIVVARECSENTASTRIAEMKRLGVIKQSIMGNYEKVQP